MGLEGRPQASGSELSAVLFPGVWAPPAGGAPSRGPLAPPLRVLAARAGVQGPRALVSPHDAWGVGTSRFRTEGAKAERV